MEQDTLGEFYEKVGTEKTQERSRRRGAFVDPIEVQKTDSEPKPGQLVQYSLYETGYMATTSTVRVLPAGCFRLKAGPQGLWLDPVKIVTDSLIRFPDMKSESVIAEIDQFWQLKDKFAEFGFSHKRGVLLWGPPGSGKTCTVAIVIQKMIAQGGLILLAESPKLLSAILAQVRSVEPERQIVVIWEDLDAVIEQNGESEVLAVLDGESQVDNVVFIATTNYPEKLDGRITNRPSRFDRIEKIDVPNAQAREIYLQTKLGTTVAPDGTDLVAETAGMSIAHLRELIVGIWCQGNKVQDVIARLKKMKIKPNSANAGGTIGF